MVYLAELVWATTGEINDQTSTKIVLNFKHVTYHGCKFTSNDLLCQLSSFFLSKHALVSFREDFGCICLTLLFAESDSKYVILHALQKLGQAAHCHIDFFLIVISTVHTLKDVLGNVEEVAKRVLYSDPVPVNLLYLKICCLGEVLFDFKLFRVPEWWSFSLNWLSCLFAPTAATNGRTQNVGG